MFGCRRKQLIHIGILGAAQHVQGHGVTEVGRIVIATVWRVERHGHRLGLRVTAPEDAGMDHVASLDA
jgi:hypothetical protein